MSTDLSGGDWPSLSSLTTVDTVENVVIFVSDALRYDFLPQKITDLGVTSKAVAPSTFTASSLPSLLSGQYPATHGVWMFDNRLPDRPELLMPHHTNVGFDAETVWIELPSAHKPPLQIHHIETESKLADLEPPFVHVIHDVGPHAPYGFENGIYDSTKQFFREYEHRRSRLVDLYRRDCEDSAGRFFEVYNQLRKRDILDDTLVVFTSDHGQCLGERANGGRFGHGHPMCPETVESPLVFAGAGLPTGESYPTLLSGVDIAPTLLSAQGRTLPADVDGTDMWESAPDPSRRLRSDVWQHLDVEVRGVTTTLSLYAATSIWDRDGGYVFHRKSRAQRAAGVAYDTLFRGYAPAWFGNASVGKVINLAEIAFSDTLSYGSPTFSAAEARESLPRPFGEAAEDRDDRALTDDQKEQLRDLGYIQ